jgi:hypothetical protein
MDDREKRVKREVNRLKKIYKNISANKKEMIKELINRASFLLIISQDMENQIKSLENFTVLTINSSQEFTKPNPLVKEYRDTVKSYQTIIKQLNDLVKVTSENSNSNDPDELEEFMK